MSAPEKPIKVVGFNGSAKKDGNTAKLLEMVFTELRKEGIECEMVMVGNADHVRGCRGCNGCKATGKCVHATPGDPVNEWYAKMMEADGIILGSPTHYAAVSVEMKSLIDRCGWISMVSGGTLKNKIGAAVVAVRRGGAISVFDQINHFFTISQMHIVGSSYWNEGIGLKPGDVENDEEGKRTMANLGKNMAFVLKKMKKED
ncbi:putative NADPH-dependent FMN reductase [Monocercomonoides exilis]|uniref:putative NADPH-dependent FMN reductase n=1 Tax=Monocercomonoides exilis TaxID=2049356 RepID=UPI003559BEB8|nr:putative NADPH-dependent FMN reductase [Monocercomonoides exilis]|eukprot:MONOS_6994.1-p1 / transcript=MONOS_6994.1 / gene=MONOS_6994 / organism=Monocercomonoides_exilis_PA203 / gene_product=NADPH-dependent FMN reductase / transcript_product=NADPH-dependent FMN reductase / location=Mono_scaffold00230:45177-46094(-) / protein_length=201 / sequence_SO=supercontig / SO=protein_coding / is_pseudo=false